MVVCLKTYLKLHKNGKYQYTRYDVIANLQLENNCSTTQSKNSLFKIQAFNVFYELN